MYAVMEIRGQGGELIAKLINQDGSPFYVKKGTTLQSGHVIDEITTTYVRAEKQAPKTIFTLRPEAFCPWNLKIRTGSQLKG